MYSLFLKPAAAVNSGRCRQSFGSMNIFTGASDFMRRQFRLEVNMKKGFSKDFLSL